MGEKNNQKKEITMDDLVLMVAKGFNEVNEKVDNGFKDVRKEIAGAKDELKAEITNTKNEIKTELNKKADIFTHNDLEYRVEKLEDKVGVTLKKNMAAV